MENILLPFLYYYWFFGLLLSVGKWVIVTGIILVTILKLRLDTIRARISGLPTFVQRLAIIVAFLGILVTMPTSYLYGALGSEIGTGIGRFLDSLIGLPWPIFRLVVGVTGGIVSIIALMAWALIVWWTFGAVLGLIFNAAFRFLRKKLAGQNAS